jgi:hypothetical protein
MVSCPITFYKCPLAQFCRFFYARPTQSSCGRNSVSATSLVREFSCGRCRREQQSSTGDPQFCLEFDRVPPPARCPRCLRAASGHRFRETKDCAGGPLACRHVCCIAASFVVDPRNLPLASAMSARKRRSLSDAGNREREGASAWIRLVLIAPSSPSSLCHNSRPGQSLDAARFDRPRPQPICSRASTPTGNRL